MSHNQLLGNQIMDTDITQKIVCSDCGERLPVEWISSGSKDNCPKCGSPNKTISIDIVEKAAFDIKESLAGKMKDKNYNSKKNPRYEFYEGDDKRKSDGKWMQKSRIIDKYKNEYFEKVVDPETGEVIHQCEESLSEHFGHGSAKFKKD
jgi:DNA-directed RNA polymerase subunit RPC12/RpoP